MSNSQLDLLIVDDCEDDAALVARQFTKAGYEVSYICVQTLAGMAGALEDRNWDAVISDVSMPSFSAAAALDLYLQRGLDCPFMVVSGVVAEENAVALLKAGAHDFVLKSRLARLVPAFEREQRERANRRAHREAEEARRISEERYALAEMGSNDGLWDWNLKTNGIYFSPRWLEMVGLVEDDSPRTPATWLDNVHPEDRPALLKQFEAHLNEHSSHFTAEHRLRHSDGSFRWVLARGVAITDCSGEPCRMAGSLTDITAAKVAELRLREANAKLEAAVVSRTRFLASASHDMRQPIQALFCFAAILGEKLAGDAGGLDVLVDLENSLGSLKDLLDALLDISKLDAGMVKPEPLPVPIAPIIDRVLAEMAPAAQAKGITLRMVRTDEQVRTDPGLLARMLRNLVENAIRYTDRGGVLVGCRRRGNRVRLEVWDTGLGISDSHRKLIFEEFYQVGNSERDRQKGLGLGLSIVSRLAKMLHHAIEVESRPGSGSMFALVLPREAAASVAAPCDAPAEMEVSEGTGGWLVLIEDELMVATAMARLITGWGFEVVVADSAEDAVRKARPPNARNGPPRAIVADYRLRDGETGMEAIEAVRKLCGRAIPSIVVTGDTGIDRLHAIHATGAVVLHKPVPPRDLRRTLTAIIAKDDTRC